MTNFNQNSEPQKNEKICTLKKIKSAICSFSPSKPFIASTCLMLGIGVTLLSQKLSNKNSDNYLAIRHPAFFYFNDAFADNDLFAEMEEMRKNMERDFANHQRQMEKIFSDAKNYDGNTSKVSTNEDADNYYYQLDFSGFKKEEIQVSIKDNMINFIGETKQGKNDKNNKANSTNSFHYSFLAPQFDHKKEPEIIHHDNQVIVKLAKKK